MSFLSDLGGFLGEVQQFNEQLDTVKQEVTSSVVDVVTQGKSITGQVASDVSNSASSVQQTATTVVDDVKQTLKK